MNKTTKTILSIILAVTFFAASAVLCACQQQQVLLVTVNADGGTVGDFTVKSDGTLVPPSIEPTKAGYTFAGWYKDSSFNSEWDFATDKVTTPVTLYAKWTANSSQDDTKELEFKLVTINADGGTVGDFTVKSDGTLNPPATEPTKAGYTFAGWYKDSSFNSEWDFTTDKVSTRVTLYAKWTANSSQDSTQELEFKLNIDEESYSVVGIGTVTDTDIVIPATYKGKPVTVIGRYAFDGCAALTSLIVPDSIVRVDNQAFNGCVNLHFNSYNYGKYLGSETNPYHIFVGERGGFVISAPTLHEDTKVISYNAFHNDSFIKEISIPDGVVSIGESAFLGCSDLSSVTIPETVTVIGLFAFQDCSKLTKVNIPSGVKNIYPFIFYNCKSLTDITIPDSVEHIYQVAFYGCTSLQEIKFSGTVSQWNSIEKESTWNAYAPINKVICSDGEVAL